MARVTRRGGGRENSSRESHSAGRRKGGEVKTYEGGRGKIGILGVLRKKKRPIETNKWRWKNRRGLVQQGFSSEGGE